MLIHKLCYKRYIYFVPPSRVAGAVIGGSFKPCGPVGLVPEAFAAADALCLAFVAVAPTVALAIVGGDAAGGATGIAGGVGIFGDRKPI